jgi:hypothetical protein
MMKQSSRFLVQGGWALITSLALTACAAYSVAANDPTKGVSLEPGYPGPTLDSGALTALPPLPTDADGSPNDLYSYFATPSPEEAVVVTEIMEIVPEAKVPARYSIESQPLASGPAHWRALYLDDLITRNKVRLGNDSGTAIDGPLNDKYFLWFFLCNPDPCQEIKPGLHAYSLASGQDLWITNEAYHTQGSVQIAGQWVTYLGPAEKPGRYTVQLDAYNLLTGKNLLIAKDAVQVISGNRGDMALNEEMVAWIKDGPTVGDWTLHVYDLTTQSDQQIVVELQNARHLSISRNIVVWRDVFWRGYDLKRKALFTIPVVPPGWKSGLVQKDGPVIAKGDRLYWTLQVNGEDHSFTALIVPKGQGPQPTHVVPTPHLKLTAYP